MTEFPWNKWALYRLIKKIDVIETRHHSLLGRDQPCGNLWTRL